MRLFVAVPLPPPVLDQLESSATRLRRYNLPGRIVSRGAMHLTLKFLGHVGEQQVPPVQAVLSGVSKLFSPFQLTLVQPGAFPNRRNPRVIFVGVGTSAPLQRLQASIEESLQPLGFGKENRPYRPHLTLMRLKSRPDSARWESWIQEEQEREEQTFIARQFNLYESRLSPSGACHSVLETFHIEGPGSSDPTASAMPG